MVCGWGERGAMGMRRSLRRSHSVRGCARSVVAALSVTVAVSTLTSCITGQRPTLGPPSTAGHTASAKPTKPTQPSPPPSFTVAASGDILIHTPLADQAADDAKASGADRFDFRPIFAGVRQTLSAADLAICHLETPLARPEGPYSSYPAFNVPPQLTQTLRDVGYDTCSTASNHTLDMGVTGVTRTLDTLDAAGLKHTGSARSAAEQATPLILTVKGVRVAQLSYAYGFNGIAIPSGKPWIVNQIDPAAILDAARRARAAGAHVVIVSLHWGIEYQHKPTDEQKQIARTLLADPAVDLIVGHHAHVTQPFERVNGKWVVYGMGNLVARHDEPRGSTEEGMIARFRFTRDGAGRWSVTTAEYVPTYVDLGPPIRLVNLPAKLADPRLPAETRARYEQAQVDTDQVADSLGATGVGLSRGRP